MVEVTTQDEVIAFLLRSGTLATGSAEVVETHASIVFLAGERAFKLKRALRYDYLDYSTLERRRVACEAELNVNRPFAPSLYEHVEPITRDAYGALHVGGDGEAVDWLVVMRRFDQAAPTRRAYCFRASG